MTGLTWHWNPMTRVSYEAVTYSCTLYRCVAVVPDCQLSPITTDDAETATIVEYIATCAARRAWPRTLLRSMSARLLMNADRLHNSCVYSNEVKQPTTAKQIRYWPVMWEGLRQQLPRHLLRRWFADEQFHKFNSNSMTVNGHFALNCFAPVCINLWSLAFEAWLLLNFIIIII